MSDTTLIWLDILQIIIPALLIVGGGAIAYWKFLQEQENKSQQRAADREQALVEQEGTLANNKLKAEEAVWVRLKATIDIQAKRIDHLEEEVEKLRAENKLLRNMLKGQA